MMASAVYIFFSIELSISIWLNFCDSLSWALRSGGGVRNRVGRRDWEIQVDSCSASHGVSFGSGGFHDDPKTTRMRVSQFDMNWLSTSKFDFFVECVRNRVWSYLLELLVGRLNWTETLRRLGIDRSRIRTTKKNNPVVAVCDGSVGDTLRYTRRGQNVGGTETMRVWLAPSDDKKKGVTFSRCSTIRKAAKKRGGRI